VGVKRGKLLEIEDVDRKGQRTFQEILSCSFCLLAFGEARIGNIPAFDKKNIYIYIKRHVTKYWSKVHKSRDYFH